MEFNEQGGIFTLQMMRHGLWEGLVPWAVAEDGFREVNGRDADGPDDLKLWLDANLVRFADMIASRVDETQAPARPDDPRVINRQI